ncbi:carboxypeptidase regulatory-like domain-containing protein [Fulvivirga sediminis]|uniref:Carboxypeptidase regulatory-like domain-containing protein n=1 Tax=Fulvivirga sediminis TaxID=2803949 RepID=A0A937F5Z3_9BACT|nr:carboxypeptidase regulatory-like domain-containing protein [Fulvivirga sediminis]MBL3655274.1 carboxypeptidase regulatory-like domain-containing protein [Fulvivirga sediminis]
MKNINLLLLCLIYTICSCKGTQSETMEQGIKGTVTWSEGNLMPGPGKKSGTNRPVEREIHIYEATKINDTEHEGTFYKNISTKLAAKVQSNEDGEFMISLPAGKYSIFTKEEKGLFANNTDGQGYIEPVEVKKDQVTEVTININYMAVY